MKKCFVMLLLVVSINSFAQDYQLIIENISKSELGSVILQQIQVQLGTQQSYQYSIIEYQDLSYFIQFLNSIEKQIAQEEQEDDQSVQGNNEKLSTERQELLDSIAETQYSQSFLGDQVANFGYNIGKYNLALEEQQYILNEQSNLMEQLQSMRDNEESRYSTQKDDILSTVDIVKRSKYLIAQLLPQSPVFVQQQYNTEDRDQLKQFIEFNRNAVKSLGDKNPYIDVLQSFAELATSAPLQKPYVDAMVNTLSQLYNDLMDANSNLFEANEDRDVGFTELLEHTTENRERWLMQIADLQSEVEKAREQSQDLNTRRQQEQDKQSAQERQSEDLQILIESAKVDYGDRKREREEYLKYVRQIKQILQEDFQGASQSISKLYK